MANYTYKLITKEGKEKKGSVEADTREKAMSALKVDGNTVISLEEGNILNKDIKFGGKKVKSRDLSIFCRQFNSLLKAGVGIVASLEMLADQTENKKLQKSIRNVRDNVQRGDTLATSMRKEGTIFPNILISMVEAGEASGNLEVSLQRMAVHFEKDTRLKGMIKKALIYPCLLLVVIIGIIIIMVVKVLPSFADMFSDLGSDMPGITKALLGFSDVLTHRWYVFILVIGAIVAGYNAYKRTPSGSRVIARMKLKAPIFGKLRTKTESARFSRTFSTMLSSGMPMIEAIAITAKTMENVLFKDALENSVIQVQRGLALSQPLKNSGLFPPLVIHMVGIGEETGNIEEMLNNCANYYDEEVELATQQISALMEPIIIIIMAAVVCLLIASIYSPLMTLYNSF